jgi:hypothetical protein
MEGLDKISIPRYEYEDLIKAALKLEQYRHYCENMNLNDIVEIIECEKQ